MKVDVAGAPVSFGVFELTPEGAETVGPDQLLEALQESGYEGVDLGPLGFLGEGAELRRRLSRFGLGLAGGWVQLPLLLLFSDHPFPFVPDLTWIWHARADSPLPVLWVLSRVHFALLPALAGLALMAVGVRRVLIQRAAVRAQRERHEDRLRRVQDYQRDGTSDTLDGRREPFISGLTAFGMAEKNPAQRGARAG